MISSIKYFNIFRSEASSGGSKIIGDITIAEYEGSPRRYRPRTSPPAQIRENNVATASAAAAQAAAAASAAAASKQQHTMVGISLLYSKYIFTL